MELQSRWRRGTTADMLWILCGGHSPERRPLSPPEDKSMVRRRTTTIALLATGVDALPSGACSIFFSSGNEQWATDDDCRQRREAFERPTCSLGSLCVASAIGSTKDGSVPDGRAGVSAANPIACVQEALPSLDPNRKVDLSIRSTDFISNQPPSGIAVGLRAQTDSLCNNPRATLEGNGGAGAGPDSGSGSSSPKVDGTVAIKVESGFESCSRLNRPRMLRRSNRARRRPPLSSGSSCVRASLVTCPISRPQHRTRTSPSDVVSCFSSPTIATDSRSRA